MAEMNTRNATTAAVRIKYAFFPLDIFMLSSSEMATRDRMAVMKGVYLPSEQTIVPANCADCQGIVTFARHRREVLSDQGRAAMGLRRLVAHPKRWSSQPFASRGLPLLQRCDRADAGIYHAELP